MAENASSAPVEALLGRLEGVQRSGRGYRARCPACGGRSRKLSVSEGEDGRVLVHCFGGCEPLAVIQSVGLSLADLFPAPIAPVDPHSRRDLARRMRTQACLATWAAALEVLEFEATLVQLAAGDLAAGKALPEPDRERLTQAAERIADARAHLRPVDIHDLMATVQRGRP